jgi:hypothetical protein
MLFLIAKHVGIQSIQNLIPLGEEIKVPETPGFTLKDYQSKIMDRLMTQVYSPKSIEMGTSSCILDLEPGKGKTYIAMALIQQFARKTLFIIPNKSLLPQTLATLKAAFPHLRVGQYNAERKEDGDIVVMTVQSATNSEEFVVGRKQPLVKWREYFDRFGLTIMDEVHEYCTSQRNCVFYRCASRITLGLSGTPNERPDGMDAIGHYWLGSPVQVADLVAADAVPAPAWKAQLVCVRYHGPDEFTKPITSAAGTISAPQMTTQFSKDPYRSQLIVDMVVDLVNQDPKNRVFVFLDRTTLATLAREYLQTELPGNQISLVIGTHKTVNAREGRVVLGTFKCIGTGISWDEFNCIVYWHPRRNKHMQFLKRIFREFGDRSILRRVYFIQDYLTSLKSQYSGVSGTWKKLFPNEKPIIDVVKYTDIEVSPEITELSRKFVESFDPKEEELESESDSDSDSEPEPDPEGPE